MAFDTAGPVVGVALWCAGPAGCRIARVRRGAEAHLIPWANALCQDAGITLADLDGIAVARGPGAFTGVRVGMATATGLALGLGKPIWSGSSLHSRAHRVGSGLVLSVLDARKGRVYAALYRDRTLVNGPADVVPAIAAGWANAAFVATGEGASVFAQEILAAGGAVAVDADHPAVDSLAELGAEGLARGEGIDAAAVRPEYLRAPDAQKPTR